MRQVKIKNTEKQTSRTLLKKSGFSKKAREEILATGYLIDGKKAIKSVDLPQNSVITINIPDEDLDYQPVFGDLDIVYEDENILVINKRSGITINSKGQVSLANNLARYFSKKNIKSKIRFVNRLDMGTSGLLMVAKNKYAQAFYQKQLEEGSLKKSYLAAVEGSLNIDKLVEIKTVYKENEKRYVPSRDGVSNRTYFETKNNYWKYSIIQAELLTGKTHQIRVSLAYLGHPIIGDRLYGSNYNFDRFLLHSYRLTFVEFLTGKLIELESRPNFTEILSSI